MASFLPVIAAARGLLLTSNPIISTPGNPGPYRPVQWSNPSVNLPALTMTVTQNGQTTAYVFDTSVEIQHEQNQVITLNPVQTGTAISDHAYLEPAHITAEIAMSDSVQSFTVGQFATAPSRSVSAFRILLAIQQQRSPVSIATRLNTYTNMMIASVRATENQESRYGLRAWVTFQQIITANVQTVQSTPNANGTYNPNTDSTRPQTTSSNLIGSVPVSPVPSSIQQQNNVENASPSSGLAFLPTLNNSMWGSYPINSGGF